MQMTPPPLWRGGGDYADKDTDDINDNKAFNDADLKDCESLANLLAFGASVAGHSDLLADAMQVAEMPSKRATAKKGAQKKHVMMKRPAMEEIVAKKAVSTTLGDMKLGCVSYQHFVSIIETDHLRVADTIDG